MKKLKKITLKTKGEQIKLQIKDDCFVIEYNNNHYLISDNKIERI